MGDREICIYGGEYSQYYNYIYVLRTVYTRAYRYTQITVYLLNSVFYLLTYLPGRDTHRTVSVVTSVSCVSVCTLLPLRLEIV